MFEEREGSLSMRDNILGETCDVGCKGSKEDLDSCRAQVLYVSREHVIAGTRGAHLQIRCGLVINS